MPLKTLQNFYKAVITTAWATGTGNRYVSILPTPTSGTLVINPSDTSKREIIDYSATGTDSGGNYITVSARGVGGTTEQTHAVGESVRMNITAEMYAAVQTELDLKVDDSQIDTDGTLAANSDTKVASQKATKTYTMPLTYLDTDVTLAANSDTKVASQKATKAYADALAIAGAPNASTTAKGIVEEATQAEIIAGTAAGSTAARLFINPSTFVTALPSFIGAAATTAFPKPVLGTSGLTSPFRATNTQMYFGLVELTEYITVNKLSFYVASYTSSGTFKVAIYSQDGGTKLLEITSATISSANQLVTTTVSPAVTLLPGKYYVAHLSTGGNFEVANHALGASMFSYMNLVTGEVYYQGYKTVTASTIPSTFDPTTSVTADSTATLGIRLDN